MTEIENNTCIVPESILTIPGNINIGVYAYQNIGDKLNLRYSPTPDSINISEGSYRNDLVEAIAPEKAQDLIIQVKELIAETDTAIAEVNACVARADTAINEDIARNDLAVDNAIAKINSIRFEIDENGYLILTEND